jgi:hypothetical protein
MHTLSAEFRFPKPRWRIDGSVIESPPPMRALAGYVEEVRLWRAAVLEFMGKSAGKPAHEAGGLSERARKALDTFLASDWTEQTTQWAAQSAYNLRPFPAGALEAGIESPLNLMLEVLRWRAAVSDCLSDIWDVIGDPYLDLDECMTIGQFLQPPVPKKICDYCLTEFPPESIRPDQHQCLLLRHVRAKWPSMPPAFASWANEAPETRVETPRPKRWWEKFSK